MLKESKNGQTHFCSECERLSRENIKKDKIIDRMATEYDKFAMELGYPVVANETTIEYFTKLVEEREDK